MTNEEILEAISSMSVLELSELVKAIEEKYDKKQIIISTHSSFVANKLGLENLLLLNDHKITKITELSSTDFFKKISGYDTLRLILCKKAILVEGDSDELVVQKAYMKQHNNHLPIENGVDVISVGTSFLRFLELAVALNLKVDVVTDNDGDISAIEKKYANYIKENKKNNIKICYDEVVDTGTLKISNKPYNYNTHEPKLLKANGNNLVLFNEILGSNFKTIEELQKYMKHHKTETALAVFETDKDVVFPDYIMEAVKDE